MRSRLSGVLFLGVAFCLSGPLPAAGDMLGHGGVVRALAVSPDGTQVLSGGFDYTARLWAFDDQRSLAVLDGHAGPVNSVAFLPDGKRVVTGSDDGTVILWDAARGTLIRRFEGHRAKVIAVAVSGSGRLMASASWDRTVRLWDIETGTTLRSIEHPSDLTAVRFFDHDRSLVTGARDGILRLWRVSDGAQTGTLKGHSWVVTQIAVSPVSDMAISASTDTTVRLWDLRRRVEIATFKEHDQPVYGIAISPDGKSALSAGRSGKLLYWDIATRSLRNVIQTDLKPVWAVAFSRDGRFGLSAGSDGALGVWHLETGHRIGIPGEGDAGPKPWLESDHPGARVYRKCAACHSLSADGPRRSGPHFAGLFGRRAGTVEGYKYSAALRRADIVWNDETLFRLFDEGPNVYIPGTKMPVQRITRSADLRNLIDYMRQLTAPGGTAN